MFTYHIYKVCKQILFLHLGKIFEKFRPSCESVLGHLPQCLHGTSSGVKMLHKQWSYSSPDRNNAMEQLPANTLIHWGWLRQTSNIKFPLLANWTYFFWLHLAIVFYWLNTGSDLSNKNSCASAFRHGNLCSLFAEVVPECNKTFAGNCSTTQCN